MSHLLLYTLSIGPHYRRIRQQHINISWCIVILFLEYMFYMYIFFLICVILRNIIFLPCSSVGAIDHNLERNIWLYTFYFYLIVIVSTDRWYTCTCILSFEWLTFVIMIVFLSPASCILSNWHLSILWSVYSKHFKQRFWSHFRWSVAVTN